MNRILLSYGLVLFLFISVGCSSKNKLPKEDVNAIILSIMDKQEKAWNDGDLEKFMEGYWKDEDLSFVGSKLTKGWQTTLDNYKRSYPDKAAMGTLTFDIMQIKQMSSEVYHVIGRYNLVIGERNPSGMFSLVWKRINGKWLIVADHSS